MAVNKERQAYIRRANEAVAAARDAMKQNHLEMAVSRAYYACFYAMHAQLAGLGESAGSHKQTAILFRKYVIKTGLLDARYSVILRELAEWRAIADYAPNPDFIKDSAHAMIEKAADFVEALLSHHVSHQLR